MVSVMKIASVFLFVCLFACQDSIVKTTVNEENKTQELVTYQDIEDIRFTEFLPDPKVLKEISNWEKYNELDRVVQDVKSANLSFFRANSEIVSTLMEELKTTIPESMNSPQVFSRVIALETKVFKLESTVNLSNVEKKQMLESINEFLIAFSNLNLQMNKKIEKESQKIIKPN